MQVKCPSLERFDRVAEGGNPTGSQVPLNWCSLQGCFPLLFEQLFFQISSATLFFGPEPCNTYLRTVAEHRGTLSPEPSWTPKLSVVGDEPLFLLGFDGSLKRRMPGKQNRKWKLFLEKHDQILPSKPVSYGASAWLPPTFSQQAVGKHILARASGDEMITGGGFNKAAFLSCVCLFCIFPCWV